MDDNESAENVVLVASAESILKSAPVRRTLEQRLVGDLKLSLTRAGYDSFSVEKDAARMVVRGIIDSHGAALFCARVFGVAYAAPAIMVPAKMDTVLSKIMETAGRALEPHQTFAIRCHRSSPSFLSRREIEVKGGSEVLHRLSGRHVSVKLKEPDVTISVDLAGDRVYIYHSKLIGPSGLPLSSQWKLLAVLDSGVLTLLAAYAMMRRGCLVELLIPQSYLIPELKIDTQLSLGRRLRALVTRPRYRAYGFNADQLKATGTDLGQDLAYLRARIRQTALVFAKRKHFRGLVLADVSGQIEHGREIPAANLSETEFKTSADAQLPIFQPLIGLDVADLLELAREVGISADELSAQLRTLVENSEARISGSASILEASAFEEIML